MPTSTTIFLYTTIFLFGIVIGSFLNVCLYRIPEKESLIPGSHCMNCGHRLRWYDLFPIFSYVFLKGRCRYCGAHVSTQYPLIELSNGILYLIVFMANGFNYKSILYCLMTSALLVISVIDERTKEIPPALNLWIGALGVINCFMDNRHFIGYLIGMLCISVPLYILYLVTGGAAIGGGDIKLMAASGLLLGWQKCLLAFFSACIIGSVIHIIRMKVTKTGHVLAMGPYLSIGIYLSALFGEAFINWYFGMLL